jgi:hypothetical protein
MSVWRTWLPYVESFDTEAKDVHLRDRLQCTSPVCERHDVTPHHVVFQAYGGSDDPSNVTSACSSCHIHGVHEGRIKVTGAAPNLEWVLGRDPILVVRGREKVPLSLE